MPMNSKLLRFTDSAAWFRRTVAQLGAALKRLPPHRRPLVSRRR